ncbi:MAG: putative peptidoglycan glycosyltransferase FtsW [Abditibacteriaceae bacterium]
MEDRIGNTTKSHAAHIAPTRRPRGWEQRMRGDFTHPARHHKTSGTTSAPHLKVIPPKNESTPAPEIEDVGCPPCHRGLLMCLIIILGLSIPIVFSASTAIALDNHSGPTFFLWRQIIFVLIGFAAMIGISRMQRNRVQKLGWILYGITVVGLIATKWSPLGHSLGGVERWIKLGPVLFQVSELGKIALLVVLANYWSKFANESHGHSYKGILPWLVSGGLLTLPLVLLVMMQPHLSAALVLFSLFLIVPFFAGVPGWQYAKIFGGVIVFAFVVGNLATSHRMPVLKPYQQDRIAHFFSQDKNDQTAYYQTAQGLRAIERGGWIGVGPGNSLYKQGHLPAPHTDFILAVTGEDWGVLGMLVLLTLYSLLIFFCLQVGHAATNTFEMLVATGMGLLLFIQVFGNMCVVLGMMPVTGMPLPFISYGGSGLVCLLMGMGMVLGISRHQTEA